MPASTGHRAGLRPHVARSRPGVSPVLLADEYTSLQHVLLGRHPRFGAQLFLDDDLQISESDTAYGVAMASPLLELPRPARIAILGGGDGGVLRELLRTLGFAQSPRFLLVLGFIPVIGWLLGAVVFIWVLIAGIIAIRQALDISTAQAIGVALIGWAVMFAVSIVLGLSYTAA